MHQAKTSHLLIVKNPIRLYAIGVTSLTLLLYCTVLYCTVLYCTVLYDTVRYGTVRYGTVRYGTVRYCSVLYKRPNGSIADFSGYCTVLYCTVLYYCTKDLMDLLQTFLGTVLYCIVLYCTVQKT